MTTFKGEYQQTFTTKAPPKVTRDQFADLDQIIDLYGDDLEKADKIDDNTIHFLLKKQDYGVMSFQGQYSCRYVHDGDHAASWSSVGEDDNIRAEGQVSCTVGADGLTSVDYRASMELDLDVPAMMAPMIRPVLQQLIAKEMEGYVKRMLQAAEGSGDDA